MDLYGKALVDIAIDLINGYLLCSQAGTSVPMKVEAAESSSANAAAKVPIRKRKAAAARRYITRNDAKITYLSELICSGDKSTFQQYGILVSPVPEVG
jgi:hypothetical protein